MTKFVSYVSDEAIEKDAQALLAEYADAMQPLFLLAELSLAHDFAVEQHSPATRRAYRSDFAWRARRNLNA
jgi:hypothetical protein